MFALFLLLSVFQGEHEVTGGLWPVPCEAPSHRSVQVRFLQGAGVGWQLIASAVLITPGCALC